MKRFVLRLAALILLSSSAATSGAFASMDGADLALPGEDEQPSQQDVMNAVEPCGTQTMQCTVTWKADSVECQSRNTTSNCTAKYQGDHASLQEAKERCEHILGVTLNSGVLSCGPCWVVEIPAKTCNDKYVACINYGPPSCLKKEAGKTLCNRCLERCNAKDSPSGQCRNCLF